MMTGSHIYVVGEIYLLEVILAHNSDLGKNLSAMYAHKVWDNSPCKSCPPALGPYELRNILGQDT